MEKGNNKKSVVKKVKNARKKAKSKNKIINKLIPKTTSEIILSVTLIVFLIIVVFLVIKAISLKQEMANKKEADFIIPIVDKSTSNDFKVDLSNLEVDDIKEYKFMVTNYNDEKTAKEDINYQIELSKNCDAVAVKLYKGKEDKNLLTDNQKTFTIKDNSLSKEKKSKDMYYLIVRVKDEVQKKDNILIKISSIN